MIPKFRAWYAESGTMYEVKSLIFTLKSMLCVNKNALYPERMLYFDDDNVKLMQSTGLLDKNGVEIFEGDVVRIWESLYTVFYDSQTCSFRLKPHDDRWNVDYMSNFLDGGVFEVIGNIYEHPELVEK